MREVRRRSRHERDRRRALDAREAPERADAHGRAGEDDDEEEREGRDATVRELLEGNAVRLQDGVRIGSEPLARDLERAGAGALRIVGLEDVPGLLPPAQAIRDVERPEATRIVDDLGALAPGGDRVGRGDARAHRRRDDEDSREHDERAPDAPSPVVAQRAPEPERYEHDDDGRADEGDDAEDLSIRHPVRVRREVLRQARARERPTRDDERRTGSCEQEQPAPHALLREQEPESDQADRDDDARSREGEHQRQRRDVDEECPGDAKDAAMGVGRGDPEPEDDRDVREERERVPVVDRLVQAPDALVLRERGHGLRDESPHQCRHR